MGAYFSGVAPSRLTVEELHGRERGFKVVAHKQLVGQKRREMPRTPTSQQRRLAAGTPPAPARRCHGAAQGEQGTPSPPH